MLRTVLTIADAVQNMNRLGVIGKKLADNRMKLLSLELTHEHKRVVFSLAVAVTGAVLAVLAIGLAVAAITLAVEPEDRVMVLGLGAGSCALLAVGCAAWALAKINSRPKPFEQFRKEAGLMDE